MIILKVRDESKKREGEKNRVCSIGRTRKMKTQKRALHFITKKSLMTLEKSVNN